MPINSSALTKIGVFYDGTYFNKASNYYLFQHERNARLNISGLHDLIRNEVAQKEGVDSRYCQIVDAHYFRGRLSANEAKERDSLFSDRIVDDILMREGVVTHYLPLQGGHEKGVDVWFALEAYEMATYKRFDVIALVAGDGDYVPLVRKLNTLGTRVMLIGFDYSYLWNGEMHMSRTSTKLIEESTYPVLLSSVIDDRTRRNDLYVTNLFVSKSESAATLANRIELPPGTPGAEGDGTILKLLDGYGFVQTNAGTSLFFHMSSLVPGVHFSTLRPGQRVTFEESVNEKGPCAIKIASV